MKEDYISSLNADKILKLKKNTAFDVLKEFRFLAKKIKNIFL
jgi:hypothetical protein